jgi:hypothetical protein
MNKSCDRVPRKIEKAAESAPPANSRDLRDWEQTGDMVTMTVRAGTTVFQNQNRGARMNTYRCAAD